MTYKTLQNSLKSLLLYSAIIYMAISVGTALPRFITLSISSWLFSFVTIAPSIILVIFLYLRFESCEVIRLDMGLYSFRREINYLTFFVLTTLSLLVGIILSWSLAKIPAWQIIGYFVLFGSIMWFLVIGIIKPELGPISFLIIYPFLEFSRLRLHARWYNLSEIQGVAEWLKETILSLQNHDIVLVAFAIGFIFHLFLRREKSLKTSVDYPITIFLIWVLISVITARNPTAAVNTFMANWILPIIIFYATVYALRKNIKIDVFAYSLISLLFFSCFFTLQNAARTGSYLETIGTERAKVWGVIGGQVGPWIVLILPIAIYYLMKAKSGISIRIFTILTALLSIIMIIWEMQRGVLVSIFVMGLILLVFYPRYWKRAISFYLIIFLLSVVFKDKIVELILLNRPGLLEANPFSLMQNLDRWYLWRYGLEIVKNNPLWGIGPGGFWLLKIGLFNPEVSTHNIILETALESGIIASILFVIIYVTPLYQVIRKGLTLNDEQKSNYDVRPWVLALFGFFTFLMISTCWVWGYGVVVMIMLAVVLESSASFPKKNQINSRQR